MLRKNVILIESSALKSNHELVIFGQNLNFTSILHLLKLKGKKEVIKGFKYLCTMNSMEYTEYVHKRIKLYTNKANRS